MDIYTVEISTQVEAVADLRERVTQHHLVVLIQFAVAVHVRIACIAGMYTDRRCIVAMQMCQCLGIALVDTLVMVAPERVQRQTLVGLGAIAP